MKFSLQDVHLTTLCPHFTVEAFQRQEVECTEEQGGLLQIRRRPTRRRYTHIHGSPLSSADVTALLLSVHRGKKH